MTTVKSNPVESEKTLFRTQMVNGKPQIYFDTFNVADESPTKPKSKQPINVPRLPNQPKSKPVSSQKPINKPTLKKANKVTFSEPPPSTTTKNGVFLTMEEIDELVQAVKETSMNTQNNIVIPAPKPPLPPPAQPVITPVSVIQNNNAQQQQQPLAPISPRQEALGLMADKKRQKWLREKAEMDRMKLEVEYDQLKHQLSPLHQAVASDNKPPLPSTDNTQNQFGKTRLMEKKQQQWKQENAEKAPVWNPFGRPGAGAPNANEVQSKDSAGIVLNDQTHVPAAMRTNLLFGDVRFEDDVRTAKERERRQWLDDLQKQIEENKRQRFTQQETERRQDFLQENIQPLIQEAAQRHQQETSVTTTPAPPPPPTTTTTAGQDAQRSSRHDSVVQQTYDKILEATELAKYEKKKQLIEKLKRNGHQTDLLAKTLPTNVKPTASITVQKPPQEPSPKKPTTTTTSTKIEPLQLNETRRDEAVNTIDSTFRSDTSVQTDLRIPQHKQLFTFTREESDLPPQIPNHLLRQTKPVKKIVRIRSHEDQQRPRQQIQIPPTSHDDSMTSQRSNTTGPIDIVHRPLWNYQNQKHRQYVPNSRKYPPGVRPTATTNATPIAEESPKQRTSDNRWYSSDSEIHREKKPSSMRSHPPKEDTIISLFKVDKPKQDTFIITKRGDVAEFNISSLDKYENFTPYIRTDEILDPAKAFSPVPVSREASARRPRAGTITYDEHHHRQNTMAQPAPYHVPPSRQEHILKQLTAIKENLVRRQQEVATSMNAISV